MTTISSDCSMFFLPEDKTNDMHWLQTHYPDERQQRSDLLDYFDRTYARGTARKQ
jgi:hypothetical protein